MEQTLGNRILSHRKRLGLTQDQLAEKLGVTAQAVSKWENDLSCPDITMLPKLASIFGITTDILLGSAPEVVTAVTVENSREEDDSDVHIEKDNWEVQWKASRWGALTMALLVLSVGGQLLVARLLDRDIGFWSITWTSAFLIFGFMGFLRKFRFWELGAVLVGAYFALDNWSVLPFTLGGELVFPLLILLFGLSMLLDALKRPKKHRFTFKNKNKQNPSDHPGEKVRNFSITDGFLSYDGSFGDAQQDVVMPLLTGGQINTSFGDFSLDLSGVEAVSDPCNLDINASFGDLVILVPRRFAVKAATSTSFADISISGHPDSQLQGIITMNANASFGDICIRYI